MNKIHIVAAAKISQEGLDDLNMGLYSWKEIGHNEYFDHGVFTWNGLSKGYRTLDPFCMLALSCVNLLYDRYSGMNPILPEGIVMGSYTGCLLADIKYYLSAGEADGQKASPSLFRYTLPSIGAGEICIAHQIKGVNLFITCGHVSGLSAVIQGAELISRKRLSSCLVGGVEIDCPEIRRLLPYSTNGPYQTTAYFLLLKIPQSQKDNHKPWLTQFNNYFHPKPSISHSKYLGNNGMETLFQLLKKKGPWKNTLNFTSFDGHGVELEIKQGKPVETKS